MAIRDHFRSKFDEIRETFFSHDSFVVNEDDQQEAVAYCDNTLDSRTVSQPKSMKEIRLRKQLAKSRSTAFIKALTSRKNRVCSRLQSIHTMAISRDELFELRLHANLETSDRRLQELIYECLGEYEKAKGRAMKRSVHLSLKIDEQLERSSVDLEWSYFLCKLGQTFPNFLFESIDPFQSTTKHSELCSYFDTITCNRDDIRGNETSPAVLRIVQLTHRSGRAPRKRRDNSNIVSKLLSCDVNIGKNLVDMLSGALPSSKIQEVSEVNDSPHLKPNVFLSARPLSWVLLAPTTDLSPIYRNLTLANCRVYFDVAARLGKRHGGIAPDSVIVDDISEYYRNKVKGVAVEGERMAVTDRIGNHRSNPDFADFPDLLIHETDDESILFAPATIQQLKETKFYADVTRSKEYSVEVLYIAVNVKGESKLSTYLVPLTKPMMTLLLETYSTEKLRTIPTACDIMPPSCIDPDSYFCMVKNPNFQPSVDADEEGGDPVSPFAFLYQIKPRQREDERPTTSQKNKNQWDGTILWNYCRWRSCNAPATSISSPRYLCSHHTLVKQLLESTSKKKNESARFLPRKPPVLTSDDPTVHDLQLIKAASSLVEELADNKLSSTIDTFCHRISHDHAMLRQKYCSQFIPAREEPTSWKRWSTPGVLDKMLHDLDCGKQIASTCFDLEYATTAEIQGLLKASTTSGVYPVAEVAMIQKELRAGNEDSLNVIASRRKFELISSLIHHVSAKPP